MNDHVKDMIATGGRALAIIPRSYEEAKLVAADYAKTGMATRDMKTVERITMAIMAGMEVGLPPIAALNNIAIINNRPRIWGAGVPAIAMRTGQLAAWDEKVEGEGDAMMATCLVARRLTADLVIRKEVTFSVADAKQAGLWSPEPRVTKKVWDDHVRAMVTRENQPNDSPWYKYPKRMLQMRARQAFTDLFADAYCGLGIAEVYVGAEADSEMRDVTPADVVVNPLGGDDEPMVNIKVVDPDGNPIEEEGYEHPEPHGAEVATKRNINVGDTVHDLDGRTGKVISGSAPTEPTHASEPEKLPKQRASKKNAPAEPAGAGKGMVVDPQRHPDTIKDPPATAAARWGFEQYKFHVTQWVDLAVEAAGNIDAKGLGFLAETYVKDRYEREKTLRNRLGVILTAEQKSEILEFCREAVNIIKARG